MTAPYSKVLARRAVWMGVLVASLLLLTAGWHYQKTPVSGDTVFKPNDRIEQVNVALSSLGETRPNTPNAAEALQIPCDGRALAILRVRLMAQYGWSQDEVDSRLAQAASATDRWTGCSSFLHAFQLALALTSSEADLSNITIDSIGRQLTEDVTWNRNLPCILGSANQQSILLSSNAMNCDDPTLLRSIATLPKDSSYRQLAGDMAKAVTLSAVSGRFNQSGTMKLSLDATLHDRLDLWSRCFDHQECENAPALKGLRGLSLLVMDAETGTVLATWCKGKACDKVNATAPGAMGGNLLEAPPASTAKLLFALSLASKNQVNRETLQLQIKTSGQNDESVSKRNEWWERQAICDSQKNKLCSVPSQTREVSDALGFNLNCTDNSPVCGYLGMVSADLTHLSPGLIGRLAIKPRGTGVEVIPWPLYDEIRQGKKPPQGGSAYTETSQAVQAVIGAGDSRISAMGLATMPMQLWRISQNKPPLLPSVTTPRAASTKLKPMGNQFSKAATTVLGGMRKAVEPAEKGWVGAGTISPAFKAEMKKNCDGACGVWGKTGTVSRKDPGFAGTTLFSGLVDTREFSRWRGDVGRPLSPHRVLSLGVIAIPDNANSSTHAASVIAMAAVNQIILPQKQ